MPLEGLGVISISSRGLLEVSPSQTGLFAVSKVWIYRLSATQRLPSVSISKPRNSEKLIDALEASILLIQLFASNLAMAMEKAHRPHHNFITSNAIRFSHLPIGESVEVQAFDGQLLHFWRPRTQPTTRPNFQPKCSSTESKDTAVRFGFRWGS